MLAVDLDLQRAVALRAIRGNLLRLKWHAAALRFELALRRHDRALKYNPDYDLQPRRPKRTEGAGEWVRVAGGSARGGRGRFGADFPGATYGQLVRLDRAVARSQDLLREVHRYDPTWGPKEQSLTAPGSVEGVIRHVEARVAEAQTRLDQLRTAIGGNFGPPLDPPANAPASREFDARAWIDAYRSINNSSDLFGRPTWPSDRGTVAVTEVDGKLFFGMNSGAPGYTNADRIEANNWRDTLRATYSDMSRGNAGSFPNDSVYHAEATALIRAARENGGALEGRTIEIHVDREMCESCYKVLPRLGLAVGNPTVTYIDVNTGRAATMRNGRWLP